jgi:hypothetical protein
VEQHLDDPSKMHILVYSHKPFVKKGSNNANTEIAAQMDSNHTPTIEVKSIGSTLFCSPSIHKNGEPYEILECTNPAIADDFERHIDTICKKYSIPYLEAADENGKSKIQIQDLFKPDYTIFEGHNRHEALLRVMDYLIAGNASILSYDRIKPLAHQWNNQHCNPPLDDKEFEKQWTCATDFIAKEGPNPDEEDDDKGHHSAADLLAELAIENTNLFFKDQYGTAHAQVHNAYHDETIRVETKASV